MKYKTIIYKKKGPISYIILNLSGHGNSIDDCVSRELMDVCQVISQDDSINVVVIKSSGGAFLLGVQTSDNIIVGDAINSLSHLEKVVIAVIDGDAIGEGLELALACDIRIASVRSHFSLPNVARGSIPSGGGTQRLPRLVGSAKALELILTATVIDAAEAFRIGLIHKVVSSKDLDRETNILVRQIAEKAPIALRLTKEAVNKGMDLTLEQGLRLESDLYLLIQTTSDRMEGIKAFLGKRDPIFKGE